MKILVIGNGGREHALCETFYRQKHTVFCIPGNAGTKKITQKLPEAYASLTSDDHMGLIDFAKSESIDLTVVGPEAPLEKGIADTFNKHGLTLFGPTADAAKIECSKAWSKSFMKRYHIPTARFIVCRDSAEARSTVHHVFHDWGGVVIKPSGLTAGKGVVVCKVLEEAEQAIQQMMDDRLFGTAGHEIIIEEPLHGTEVSVMAFCDGNTIVPMISAQDHKRLYDEGQGPNTGGMGAYSPTDLLPEGLKASIYENILKKTMHGFDQEGIRYIGFLYTGLMLTKQGPKVLEYNCRFGDPEAQVVLPLLQSDLAAIMLKCCKGDLDESAVKWTGEAACCVVMASRGYPKHYQSGFPITGIREAEKDPSVKVYYAGVKEDKEGRAITAGGRVLGVTAKAHTLKQAIEKAYKGIENIHFEKAYYRLDIGQSALKEKKEELYATH